MADYDVIVVGGGNNGMAAATLLAKNGLKVIDLEKNDRVGGLGSTFEFFKGYKHNVGAWAMMFTPKRIFEEFEMSKYGFELITPESFFCNYGTPGEKPFIMYNNPEKLMEHVQRDHGPEAVQGLMGLFKFFSTFGAGMDAALFNSPMSISAIMEVMPGTQAKDAMRKGFYGSMVDLMDEYFAKDKYHNIKGLLAAFSCDGCWNGPYSPTSAYSGSFHFSQAGVGNFAYLPKGGMISFTEALRRNFEEKKGEVKLNAQVKKILVEKGKAVGVELENGERITSKIVVSNLDAYATMIKLVGEESLPEYFATMVKNIHYKNPFLQLFLTLKELPEFKGEYASFNEGQTRWCVSHLTSEDHIERSWDAVKYNRIPDDPPWLIGIHSMQDESFAPKGSHSCTVFGQYFPVMAPKDQIKGLLEKQADMIIDNITKDAPNFKDSIIDKLVWSPFDYERVFENTNGDFDHGTFEVGQMLDLRPVAGWSNYKTPVEGLYLCGAATHPGWGVTAINGYNSATTILKDWAKQSK